MSTSGSISSGLALLSVEDQASPAEPNLQNPTTSVSSSATLHENADSTIPTSSDAFSEFTCFPRLPIELRLAVWSLAALQPRLVAFHGVTEDGRRSKLSNKLRVTCVLPGVLHASTESRKEAIRHFIPYLGSLLNGYPVLLNMNLDVLLINSPAECSLLFRWLDFSTEEQAYWNIGLQTLGTRPVSHAEILQFSRDIQHLVCQGDEPSARNPHFFYKLPKLKTWKMRQPNETLSSTYSFEHRIPIPTLQGIIQELFLKHRTSHFTREMDTDKALDEPSKVDIKILTNTDMDQLCKGMSLSR